MARMAVWGLLLALAALSTVSARPMSPMDVDDGAATGRDLLQMSSVVTKVNLTSGSTTPVVVNVIPTIVTNTACNISGTPTVLFRSGVLSAAVTGTAANEITLTLVNEAAWPFRLPIYVNYWVRCPGKLPQFRTLQVNIPGSAPVPPNPLTPLTATLGVPLVLPDTTLLAGWTDPDNEAFGIVLAFVPPKAPNGATRGVVAPSAFASSNWTSFREIANNRITELTYLCSLPLITRNPKTGAVTAKQPGCMLTGTSLNVTVADKRYYTAYAGYPVTVTQGAYYAHPLLPPIPAGAHKVWSVAAGFNASAGTVASGTVTWTTLAVTGTLAPAPTTSTATTATFAADANKAATVTLTFAPGVTMFGFTSTAGTTKKAKMTMTVTLSDGTTLKYPLTAGLPCAVSAKLFGGTAIFGPGVTVSSAEIKAEQMTAGASLVLSDFLASINPVNAPTLTA